MDTSDVVTFVLTIVGLTLGGAAFYREFLYVKREVLFRPSGVLLGADKSRNVQIAAINAGTRAVVVLEIWPCYWLKNKVKGAYPWQGFGRSLGEDFQPRLLNPGEIAVLIVRFPDEPHFYHRHAQPLPDEPETRRLPIGLRYEVIDDTGQHWSSYRALGHVELRDALTESAHWILGLTATNRQYSGRSNEVEDAGSTAGNIRYPPFN